MKWYILTSAIEFVVSAADVDEAILKLWHRRFTEFCETGSDEAARDVQTTYLVSESGSHFVEHSAGRAYSMVPAQMRAAVDHAFIHQLGFEGWELFAESMLEEFYPL